jgi:PKD repeat protein
VAETWLWNFGDGTTSTEQDPIHTYTSAGLFTVSLTVSNAYGQDTETKLNLVLVTAVLPGADFEASVTAGDAPLAVTFTDLSTNTPTEWAWDFGDGGTSTEQDPVHTYAAVGTFDVSLTATNAAGSTPRRSGTSR